MTIRTWLRSRFVTSPLATPVDLGGRQVIVTGASPQSLGYATARILASWGAAVTVSTRQHTAETVAALRSEVPDGIVDGHALDLSDRSSVEGFSQWYLDHHGDRLDILVNNAGIHLDLMSQWQEPRLSADGIELHRRTNYLGTVHLSRLLLPLLRATGQTQGDARIVNVSSQLHSRGRNSELFEPQRPYNSWEAYGNSKLALHHFTMELQRRYQQDGLQSYCLHPGGSSGTYTRVADKGLAGNRLLLWLRKLGAPLEQLMMATPEEGAQTQVYCATAAEASGGHYFRDCAACPASSDSYDAEVAGRLWQQTEQWLNPKPQEPGDGHQ